MPTTTPVPIATPPPGVIPTTLPPVTTAAPAVNFNNINISNVNISSTYPVIGSGGVEDSYENTDGKVTVENIVLDKPFSEQLTYFVYDQNGARDEYGDPINFTSGQAGVSVNDNNESIVEINEELTVVADPTDNSGNMDIVIQLRDQNYTTIVTERSITTPGPTTTPAPITTAAAPATTTTGPATPAPTPITPTPTPAPRISRLGDSDRGSEGDTDYIPATSTETKVNVPVFRDRSSIEESTTTPVQVSSQEELITSLETYSQIEIVSDFDLTVTVRVPESTSIKGVNNPVIRTNTTAFSVKESNIELSGFTIAKTRTISTGAGILVDRPYRSSTEAPSNILITDITFNTVGTPGLEKYSPVTILGYSSLNATPLIDEKLTVLNSGCGPIQNVTITNCTFLNTPNTAIYATVVDGLNISENIIANTTSNITSLGDGIKLNGVTNSSITSNELSNIGRSGIYITGSNTNNITITDNKVDAFATDKADGFRAGLSINYGVNGALVSNNNISRGSNIWNAGIANRGGVTNVLVNSNEISDVRDGILISDNSSTFNIRNNSILNVHRYGVQTFKTWDTVISNNSIIQSESKREDFQSLSKFDQKMIGLGCGILCGTSNNVQILDNSITGTYNEGTGDSAILVTGTLLTNDQNDLYTLHALGISSNLDEIYGTSGKGVLEGISQNIVSNNTLEGRDTLLSVNKADVILPSRKLGESNNIEIPDAAIFKTNLTGSEGRIVVVVKPDSTRTVESYIQDNSKLSEGNDIIIVSPSKLNPSDGTVSSIDTVTEYKGSSLVTINTDPVIDTKEVVGSRGRRQTIIEPEVVEPEVVEPTETWEETRRRLLAARRAAALEADVEARRLLEEAAAAAELASGETVNPAPSLTSENSITSQSTKEIQALVSGLTPSSETIDMFIRYNGPMDPQSPRLVRNPSFWGSDLKGITGISPLVYWPSRPARKRYFQGVAITRRHVLIARHLEHPEVGTEIYFVAKDGTIEKRTIIGARDNPTAGDWNISVLDEDLPSNIEVLKVLPEDLPSLAPPSELVRVPGDEGGWSPGVIGRLEPSPGWRWTVTSGLVWGTDQEEKGIISRLSKLYIGDGVTGGGLRIRVLPVPLDVEHLRISTNLNGLVSQGWTERLEEHDSSSPWFIVINNEAILAGTATNPNSGPMTGGRNSTQILNQLIAAADEAVLGSSTGYTVTNAVFTPIDTLQEKITIEPIDISNKLYTWADLLKENITIDEDDPSKLNIWSDTLQEKIIIEPIDSSTGRPIDISNKLYTWTDLLKENITINEDDPSKLNINGGSGGGGGTTVGPTPSGPGIGEKRTIELIDSSTGIPINISNKLYTWTDLLKENITIEEIDGPSKLNIYGDPPLRPLTGDGPDGRDPFRPNPAGDGWPPPEWPPPDWPPPEWPPPPPPMPYIPALCRKPPVPPRGDPDMEEEERQDDIINRIDIEQQGNDPPNKIFPSPSNALQVPFYSHINFNTNITKKFPTPYNFDDDDTDTQLIDDNQILASASVTTTICPPDREDCNMLHY